MSYRNWTLVELIVVITTLSVVATLLVPSFFSLYDDSKKSICEYEMLTIQKAFRQFNNDVIAGIEDYQDFVLYGGWGLFQSRHPDTTSDVQYESYNSIKKKGWKGPYMTSEGTIEIKVLGRAIQVPVIFDPYQQPYYFMIPNDGNNQLYLISAGPNRVLNTTPKSKDEKGKLIAQGDDLVMEMSL